MAATVTCGCGFQNKYQLTVDQALDDGDCRLTD